MERELSISERHIDEWSLSIDVIDYRMAVEEEVPLQGMLAEIFTFNMCNADNISDRYEEMIEMITVAYNKRKSFDLFTWKG